jgi:hypothetical protein
MSQSLTHRENRHDQGLAKLGILSLTGHCHVIAGGRRCRSGVVSQFEISAPLTRHSAGSDGRLRWGHARQDQPILPVPGSLNHLCAWLHLDRCKAPAVLAVLAILVLRCGSGDMGTQRFPAKEEDRRLGGSEANVASPAARPCAHRQITDGGRSTPAPPMHRAPSLGTIDARPWSSR